MRSYLEIIIDFKDGKCLSREELEAALLFAADQLNFAQRDIERLSGNPKPLIKKMVEKNSEARFNARKAPIEKWTGEGSL